MGSQQNILQYEFFHVGGRQNDSLSKIITECHERAVENFTLAFTGNDTGPSIKTVVRIYDMEGWVTNSVTQIQKLEAKLDIHHNAPRSNFFSDGYARLFIHRLSQLADKERRRILSYYVKYLTSAMNGERNVSREILGHAFRPARSAEYRELRNAAKVTKSFWLFVFKPNDLLSDTNEILVNIW